MSFGRPLGQCCRYCRQHCTGLALRTPGPPLRCLRVRKKIGTASRRVVPAVVCARTARAPSPATRSAGRIHRRPRQHGAERAGRAAAEREPSAMLPAVSAALAEWSPEGHRDASERSMQTARSTNERAPSYQAARIAPMTTSATRLLPALIRRSCVGRFAAAQSSSCTTRMKPSQFRKPTAAPSGIVLAPA